MLKATKLGYAGVVKTLINNKHIDVNSRDDDVSNDIRTYIHPYILMYSMYHHNTYDKNLRIIKFNDAVNNA